MFKGRYGNRRWAFAIGPWNSAIISAALGSFFNGIVMLQFLGNTSAFITEREKDCRASVCTVSSGGVYWRIDMLKKRIRKGSMLT